MSEVEQRGREVKKLELEIGSDMEAIGKLLIQVQELFPNNHADNTPSYANQLAIALCLHHIYTAIEQIFLRISKTIDQFHYSGDNWHKELLKNMTVEVPDIRPVVISKTLYRELDNLRAFRHIVRHAYDYDLDWNRLKPICSNLNNTINEFIMAVRTFLQFTAQFRRELETQG